MKSLLFTAAVVRSALCLPISSPVLAATRYVDCSVSASGDGMSWETAFKTIQEGIDASSDGDTVIVAEGTYVENIEFKGKSIVLRSTDPESTDVVVNTVIDGNAFGPVVTFSGTEDESCVLSGFTICNGNSEFMPFPGGGITGATDEFSLLRSGAAIRNNIIAGNLGYHGGGVACCDGIIESNVIRDNSACSSGGGVFCCGGTIQNNVISGNSVQFDNGVGGGLCMCWGPIRNNTISGNSGKRAGGGLCYCAAAIEGNTISGNSAELGGGICDYPSWGNTVKATIRGNAMTGNSAREGGGLAYCHGVIEANTIAENSASLSGGGLYCCDGPVQKNVIERNTAQRSGGGLNWCNGPIRENRISANSAVGNGGGLVGCDGLIERNVICGNRTEYEGGGLESCDGIIRDNVVVGNVAKVDSGGLHFCRGTIRGNLILNNGTLHFGGGLHLAAEPVVEGNVIAGNSASDPQSVGGGLSGPHEGIARNNLIVGNRAGKTGGGVWGGRAGSLFHNNTIALNSAGASGGGIGECGGSTANCIIWGNRAPEVPQFYNSGVPSFSCIEGWTGGDDGNIAEDPQFVGAPLATGRWTADGLFDQQTFQSSLADDDAGWDPGGLKGLLVNPDTSQPLQFLIVSNTPATITVWGDCSELAKAGGSYEIYNYHLSLQSPCVDTGNNNLDVGAFDLDGGVRRIYTKVRPGWSGKVEGMVLEDDGAVTFTWKRLIDIGTYECQVFGETVETFGVEARERMDAGDWTEVFSGKVCTWTDRETTGRSKFYRVHMK